MVSLSKTKFILFLVIISSSSALLCMKPNNDITIMNLLKNETVNIQISHGQEKTSVGVIHESYTLISNLSPNSTTDLTLSVMLKNTRHEVNLKLTGDQNKIYVVKDNRNQILVKDHDTQQILATLPKEEI